MKDERVYLGHIRDAINDLEEYTSVGSDVFMGERMRQDANGRPPVMQTLLLNRALSDG